MQKLFGSTSKIIEDITGWHQEKLLASNIFVLLQKIYIHK